jgi:hypothetical protein
MVAALSLVLATATGFGAALGLMVALPPHEAIARAPLPVAEAVICFDPLGSEQFTTALAVVVVEPGFETVAVCVCATTEKAEQMPKMTIETNFFMPFSLRLAVLRNRTSLLNDF